MRGLRTCENTTAIHSCACLEASISPRGRATRLPQAQMDAIATYIVWYTYCARTSEHTTASLRDLKHKAERMITALVVAFLTQASKWRFIKMHLISHYIDSIRRAGLPEHYSTQMFEHLHIEYIKNPYRASNRRTTTSQIMNSEVMRLRLESLAPILGKRKSYDTCMSEAQRTGERVMSRESWRLLVPHNRHEAPYVVPLTPDSVRDVEFTSALSADLPFLRNALNNAPDCAGRTIDTIHVHNGLAMPAAVDASFSHLPHLVRAAPMFYGRPWFSNIAVVGEDELGTTEWYAKVLILFQRAHAPENGSDVVTLDAAGVPVDDSATGNDNGDVLEKIQSFMTFMDLMKANGMLPQELRKKPKKGSMAAIS
ncbi:unnamed protein product [Closterium sp. Yama58-4]|nr:unnamed protein product [Closterium sp. Yama58-4]